MPATNQRTHKCRDTVIPGQDQGPYLNDNTNASDK